MRTVPLFATLFLLSSTEANVSNPITTAPDIDDSGICVVEFNASFNSANSTPWIENISDCNHSRIDISANPNLQSKYKIVVVPTIIVFNEGEEEVRFQANIMMQIDATEEEVQEAVDEILLGDF